MPQPLSRVAPNAGFELGNVGMGGVTSRPSLALAAMECIASWSNVENFMLRTYVALAGGAQADAAAVYLAMETSTAKSAAIRVLAERKLDAKHADLLRAIISIQKSAQKDRDKLAHWIWGTTDALPEALLLSDPRNLELKREEIFVYRVNDFENMRARFNKISGWGLSFTLILHSNPTNNRGGLYAQLCAESEISDILRRRAAPKILPPQQWPEWLKPVRY